MQIQQNKININKFCNYYCDGLYCSLGEFLKLDQQLLEKVLRMLSNEEIEILIEYAVCKNISSGVGELNIKVPEFGMGVKALEKYGVKGKEIVSAKQFYSMPTTSLVGGQTILDIESLLDYNQNALSDISDFSAKAEVPLAINVASDLEEVGKIVNMYKLSPVEVLESFGLLDRESFVYGLNYIDKDDQKLIKEYDKMCVFSLQDDGNRGKGAINLYNFIYNHLKFGFSSGKCYNVNMLCECKLAMHDTFNLMHESEIILPQDLLNAATIGKGEQIEIEFSNEENFINLFDRRVQNLCKDEQELRNKTIEIVKRIKEKI